MARNPDMEPVNSWQPKALKELILGALGDGESLAEFCRKAFVRELKKRGVKSQVPDVKPGRPPLAPRNPTMKYEVKSQATSEIISTHKTEESAVKKAKKVGNAVVIAHEVSGTYESHMQVWPTVGICYSN